MYNMMTIVNTDIQYRGKFYGVNFITSHHKETFFLSFYYIYIKRWMLAEPIMVIISQNM